MSQTAELKFIQPSSFKM